MERTNLINLNSIYYNVDGNKEKPEIIHNINMKVKKGEFVCIMGPTGCGKSTLLKIIAGLLPIDDGIYLFDGEMYSRGFTKEILKEVGIAYQTDSLFEWLTVEKNIRQPIDVFGAREGIEVTKRLEYMMDMVGLKNYRNCYPHELSGGMRQRCAFARALVHNPRTLLLDQPFGALDAITRKLLGLELLKEWHETNKTVVMITNNVGEALMLGQRVVVLSQAPATIIEELENPLSYEERMQPLQENDTYTELSRKLNALVHKSNE